MVLSILCSASYRLKFGETVIDLCTPHILNTLMQACRMVYKRGSATSWDSHGAPMVLSSIIENRNFAALLKYDFIFQVYNMANPARDHKHCTLCQDVRTFLCCFFFVYFLWIACRRPNWLTFIDRYVQFFIPAEICCRGTPQPIE